MGCVYVCGDGWREGERGASQRRREHTGVPPDLVGPIPHGGKKAQWSHHTHLEIRLVLAHVLPDQVLPVYVQLSRWCQVSTLTRSD